MTPDPLPIDHSAFFEAFDSMVQGLATYWWPRKSAFGASIPFAYIANQEGEVSPKVVLSRMAHEPTSNHDVMARDVVRDRGITQVKHMRDMLVAAAPVFAHPMMAWKIEILNDHSDEGKDTPTPIARLSIGGNYLLSRKDWSAECMTIETAAKRLSTTADTLRTLTTPGDRRFKIEGSEYPGNSPEEALLIYDTLTKTGLLQDSAIETPRVWEAFDSGKIRKKMHKRFGPITAQMTS